MPETMKGSSYVRPASCTKGQDATARGIDGKGGLALYSRKVWEGEMDEMLAGAGEAISNNLRLRREEVVFVILHAASC